MPASIASDITDDLIDDALARSDSMFRLGLSAMRLSSVNLDFENGLGTIPRRGQRRPSAFCQTRQPFAWVFAKQRVFVTVQRRG